MLHYHLNMFKNSPRKKRMTPFPPSQGGGPGRSPPPAVTWKYRKRPRSWGSGRSVPVGSMETRDAGGLAPRWGETELLSGANGGRGKRSAPRTAERGSGPSPPVAVPVPAGQGGVCRYRAPTREPRRRAPPPLPSVSTGNGRNFAGTEEASPRSQGTLYLPSGGPLPSRPECLASFRR